jgi:hypothetical protein
MLRMRTSKRSRICFALLSLTVTGCLEVGAQQPQLVPPQDASVDAAEAGPEAGFEAGFQIIPGVVVVEMMKVLNPPSPVQVQMQVQAEVVQEHAKAVESIHRETEDIKLLIQTKQLRELRFKARRYGWSLFHPPGSRSGPQARSPRRRRNRGRQTMEWNRWIRLEDEIGGRVPR